MGRCTPPPTSSLPSLLSRSRHLNALLPLDEFRQRRRGRRLGQESGPAAPPGPSLFGCRAPTPRLRSRPRDAPDAPGKGMGHRAKSCRRTAAPRRRIHGVRGKQGARTPSGERTEAKWRCGVCERGSVSGSVCDLIWLCREPLPPSPLGSLAALSGHRRALQSTKRKWSKGTNSLLRSSPGFDLCAKWTQSATRGPRGANSFRNNFALFGSKKKNWF